MRPSRAFLLLTALLAGSAHAGDFALKDGDRVVFYGDSITDQRLYTLYAEAYVVTRFPGRNITFVHSGWGGDRVTGGGGGPIDVRLERDVIAYKPNVVTIMLGMNDASYQPFKEDIFNTYAKGYEHIVETLQAKLPGVRLYLIQPSPFDDVTRKPNFEGGYNAVLLKYADFVKQLAEKIKAATADLNSGLVEATKKADAEDHDKALKFNPDRVHPAPAGQLLMAEGLLKAWEAPALVSSVEIHTEAASSVKAEGAKISDLVIGDSISWTEEDAALPFPLNLDDPIVMLAMKSSDFVDALDRQVVKVGNLSAASYALKIDGKEIGKFTKEQLAEGINIAPMKTPMWEQAQQVLDLTRKHNDVHFTEWRMLPSEMAKSHPESYKAAQAGIDKLEAEIVKDQRAAAIPKPHKFELVPAA